ncbi:MAG: late competence development ComFB family protein [Pseudanabaenaceae cyanobacterium bins.39]|nr:late competence development ComFB family protein [Pseudanabaenaceae cyanobacterium bins.39]
MESCRNVMLEFVYEEANAQIQALGSSIRHKYNIDEVTAFALNRLPPMFVSTNVELLAMRKKCMTMSQEIHKVVRKALIGVRRDPLRQADLLEEIELANAPYVLTQVQELLGQKILPWCDVPLILEQLLEKELAKYNSGNLSSQRNKYGSFNRSYVNTQAYLNKNKSPQSPNLLTSAFASQIKKQEYDLYLLESKHIVHSLERLVIRMAQNRAANFPKSELRFIRLEDVLARTLNRLPPLYATTSRGLGHLRQYAQMNIGSEVAIIVHESLIEVRKHNLEQWHPLLFEKIRYEREQSLKKVSNLLFEPDVRWQNLLEVVSKSLNLARTGQRCWQRSPSTVDTF